MRDNHEETHRMPLPGSVFPYTAAANRRAIHRAPSQWALLWFWEAWPRVRRLQRRIRCTFIVRIGGRLVLHVNRFVRRDGIRNRLLPRRNIVVERAIISGIQGLRLFELRRRLHQKLAGLLAFLLGSARVFLIGIGHQLGGLSKKASALSTFSQHETMRFEACLAACSSVKIASASSSMVFRASAEAAS